MQSDLHDFCVRTLPVHTATLSALRTFNRASFLDIGTDFDGIDGEHPVIELPDIICMNPSP